MQDKDETAGNYLEPPMSNKTFIEHCLGTHDLGGMNLKQQHEDAHVEWEDDPIAMPHDDEDYHRHIPEGTLWPNPMMR